MIGLRGLRVVAGYFPLTLRGCVRACARTRTRPEDKRPRRYPHTPQTVGVHRARDATALGKDPATPRRALRGRGGFVFYDFSRMTAAVRYEHALATPVRVGCAGCPSPAISAILPRPRPSPLSRHPLAPSRPVERILGPSGDSA